MDRVFIETVDFIPSISSCIEVLEIFQPWNQAQICLPMPLLESIYLHLIPLSYFFKRSFH